MNVFDGSQLYEAWHLTDSELRELTCWAKYHTFYFPQGAFNLKGHIRRSSWLYKARKEAHVARMVHIIQDQVNNGTAQGHGQSSIQDEGSSLHRSGGEVLNVSREEVPFEAISEDNHPIFSTHIRSLSF